MPICSAECVTMLTKQFMMLFLADHFATSTKTLTDYHWHESLQVTHSHRTKSMGRHTNPGHLSRTIGTVLRNHITPLALLLGAFPNCQVSKKTNPIR